MKLKYIASALVAATVLFSCDEETGQLGMSMLNPDLDYMSAHTLSFDVETQSVEAGPVFAKTNIGYIGRYTDPEFGYFESGFLTALNSTESFTLPEVYHETEWDDQGNPTKASGIMSGDSVTAVNLVVYYDEWFGDSLNACRMSAYELNKALDYNHRYTNLDPKDYYDESGLLGRVAYSAYDASIPDSVRNATDSYGSSTYTPYVAFKLPNKEFGEKRILQPYREHPEYFQGGDNFINNVFKGVYLTTDQGDGTILYVRGVQLQMQFHFFYVNDSTGVKLKKHDGTDSTYYSTNTLFASTKEVTQINRFYNAEEKIQKKLQETGCTYLKSPAGIFTQATLPYDEISSQLANDTLNGARLTFTNYRQESKYDFSMSVPNEVLLVRAKDYIKFFENNEVPDNITSYVATHNESGTNQYTFGNIARLVSYCINEKQQARAAAGDSWNEEQWMAENQWDKVYLIPVVVTTDDTSQTTRIINIQHDLEPGYAKLYGGPERESGADSKLKNPLKLEVTYTSFSAPDAAGK